MLKNTNDGKLVIILGDPVKFFTKEPLTLEEFNNEVEKAMEMFRDMVDEAENRSNKKVEETK